MIADALHSPFLAVTEALPSLDPLEAARRVPGLSFYWERPEDAIAVAGFGAAAERSGDDAPAIVRELFGAGVVRWLSGAPLASPGPFFGGLAFDPRRTPDAIWQGLGTARWVLPALAVWRRDGRAYVSAFEPEGPGAEAALRRRLAEASARLAGAAPEGAAPRVRSVRADRPAWDGLVARALGAIGAGALEKVVLARPVDVRLDGAAERLAILARLRASHPTSTTFLFAAGDAAFLGATPETLLRVDHGVLRCEALAGTRRPGGPPFGEKELREQAVVVDGIREALAPRLAGLRVAPEPEERVLRGLVHLRTPIEGRLPRDADLGALVAALHPTPAVGGRPREAALRFLREHEGFDRGWYAGALGWIGPGSAHLVVGLRSALVRGDRARLFVGAGVVAGSTAEDEWRETKAKSETMLEALGGMDAGREP